MKKITQTGQQRLPDVTSDVDYSLLDRITCYISLLPPEKPKKLEPVHQVLQLL